MFHIIDLHFQNHSGVIAAFLLETEKGPILFETGPHSSYPHLVEGLKRKGYAPGDLAGAFVTHIHLDHAGASLALAREGCPIYVHPFGYKHLLDPSKLMESARRIYKDDMDHLWGDMQAIPEDKLIAVEDGTEFDFGNVKVKALHTPGHAVHHIAWQVGEHIICGDVAGIKINGGPVVPPCPPPDINIEDWKDSIALLRKAQPEVLWLTHFGPIQDIEGHLEVLEEKLDYYANWMKPHFEAGESPEVITPQLQAMADDELAQFGIRGENKERYDFANPAWMSVAGLLRYWRKKIGG
jgi:glyoxylase-like metal-dependent hydrolase (beta-lactamase superfamily II)